jgi:hypothetical protein
MFGNLLSYNYFFTFIKTLLFSLKLCLDYNDLLSSQVVVLFSQCVIVNCLTCSYLLSSHVIIVSYRHVCKCMLISHVVVYFLHL